MINKRSNVFETNSSSVHTLTLGSSINDIVVGDDGYVHVELGYYGKDVNLYNNSYDKLCYALLTVCYTRGIYIGFYYGSEDPSEEAIEDWKYCLSDLMDTEEYSCIEDCVKTELNRQNRVCYGIKIHPSECGIDHQSQCYDSLEDFLSENKIENIHDFIFGNIVLETRCD